MTEIEIGLVVAEFCGVKTYPLHDWQERDDRRYFVCTRCNKKIGWNYYSKKLPPREEPCIGTEQDFPNSLDACIDMEDILSDSELERMNGYLENCGCWPIWRATSLQRCEAFLKVKGAWKEPDKQATHQTPLPLPPIKTPQ